MARRAVQRDRALVEDAVGADPRLEESFRGLSRQSAAWPKLDDSPVVRAMTGVVLSVLLLMPVVVGRYLGIELSIPRYLGAVPVAFVALLTFGMVNKAVSTSVARPFVWFVAYLVALLLAICALLRDHHAVFGAVGLPEHYRDFAVFAAMTALVPMALGHVGNKLVDRIVDREYVAVAGGKIGVLEPARTVAYVLALTYLSLLGLDDPWTSTESRRRCVGLLDGVRRDLQRMVRLAYRAAGTRTADREWIEDRALRAAGAVQHYRQAMMDVRTAADYEQVLDSLVRDTLLLADGDWAVVQRHPAPTVLSRVRTFTQRLLPAGVLAGMAWALPAVPGVEPSANLSGIQLSLFVAAVLALLSVDAGTREYVGSAIKAVVGR